MEFDKTQRNFIIGNFKDRNGVECSIQESSIASENCIWLGCNKAEPKVLIPGKGWTDIELPKEHVANTRMHLTQKQVAQLIPALQYFVDHGCLPD